MTMPEFGVTPQGFKARRLIDVKNQLEEAFIGEFGDVNLDAQSVIGQIIGIFSKAFADMWENEQDVYSSQYPNSAFGVSLDNVVALNGLVRLPAQRTFVIGVATGTEGTIIPQGSLARIPSTNQTFFSSTTATITSSISVRNTVQVLATAAQVYTVLIDGQPYIFSKPVLNFSGPFIPGNTINVRINGVNMPSVSYTISSANTFSLLALAIETSSDVTSATIVGNTIEIMPVLGSSVTVNSVGIIGGGPTYSLTFAAPSSTNEISTYLSAILNTNSKINTSALSNVITILANSTSSAYSIIVGSNLQITSVSSPVPFLAQTFGPIPVPANTLTQILTPVAGWTSLTNYEAGVTGRNIETDAELRLRRLNSLRISGAATVEAIRARLLQEVAGVTSVTIFENVTMTQTDIEITFSIDFVSGNNIQVEADALPIGIVPFTADQITTMNLIADLIETRSEVASATVGGIGNRDIVVVLNEIQKINLSFTITGGATQPTYTIDGGLPPKSFEAVVEGGSDSDVALKIWQTKPAGIETYGNTSVVIVDSQGTNQLIKFSRAVPVYIWVNMTITLNPQETFPVNGFQLISEAILSYGNSLGIGLDVILQRLEAQAFLVSGVATATAQIAKTYSLADTPSYVSTDIDIGNTEISVWDLNRIIVSL